MSILRKSGGRQGLGEEIKKSVGEAGGDRKMKGESVKK